MLYLYRAERTAAERRRRLALIERITSAAIATPRLQPRVEAATEEVAELLRARVVATYLLDQEMFDRLHLAYAIDDRTDLPEELSVESDHPIASAVAEHETGKFSISYVGDDDAHAMLSGLATPLRGMSRTVDVMVVGIEPDEQPAQDDVNVIYNASSQLGVILQHAMLLESTGLARDRWRQTFDSITELLTVHDAPGSITEANRAVLTLADMSEHQAVGRKLSDIFGTECEEQEAMLAVCMGTGESPKPSLHRTGDHIYQVQVTPLHDEQRQVTGCVRVARDVTSRHRAEERLAQSERRYRELTEGANDIIYTHDLEGHFLYENPAMVCVLGYSQEQLSRLTFWDLVAPESMATARA